MMENKMSIIPIIIWNLLLVIILGYHANWLRDIEVKIMFDIQKKYDQQIEQLKKDDNFYQESTYGLIEGGFPKLVYSNALSNRAAIEKILDYLKLDFEHQSETYKLKEKNAIYRKP